MRSAILVVLVCLVWPSHSAAQRSLTLVQGQRVRLTAPAVGAYQHELRYIGSRGDTLFVSADTALAVPLGDVTRLEILKRRQSYKWPGAALGLACGALVGIGIGYAVTDGPGDTGNWDFSRPLAVTVGGIGLGLLGIGVGAWVGQSIQTDRWEDVPLDALSVSVASVRDGVRIGARIVF